MRLASLRPLRSRNFALLWSAALVSNIGSWMQSVAVGELIVKLTHKAAWSGLVYAAAFLPVGLLAPVGGAVADRVDRRRWLLWTTVGETVFAVLLAVVAFGHPRPLAVVVLVFFGGAMASIGFPAYQAMLPDLVDREDLLGAVSLSSAQFNLGRVVGPAVAGIVVVAGGYGLTIALNAASFGAVVLALVLVRLTPHTPSNEQGRIWARIRTGADAARREPGCRAAIGLIGITALLCSPFIALIPAIAQKLFHNTEVGTSFLVTAQGVGAVIGALALAPLAERFGRRRLLVVNLAALPMTLVLYAVSPTLSLAVVALVLVGAAYIGILSGLNTVVQLRAPVAVRARVLSLYMMALGTVYPVGAVLQGRAADRFGLREVTAGAALLFLFVVTVLRMARPGVVGALEDPVEAEPVAASPI